MTTISTTQLQLGNCRFEILADGESFRGLGKVWIGDTLVRSGRLPLRPYTQAFTGVELADFRLLGVEESAEEVRVRLQAHFHPMPVKLMRDHSFDPIHEISDWDAPAVAGSGTLDIVLKPATDSFCGVDFQGFSYRYEYASEDTPLFYLYDMASWELDGDITCATAISQSSCSAPVVTFAEDTAWSTEGFLHFLVEEGNQNPVMTHNLPRWAGHGSFDFQSKGDKTLVGIFARVDLIRSLVCRDAGKAELKCFDKHIFDQALQYATAAKAIMLNTSPKTDTALQNLWTWIYDTVDRRARAEFGIKEEPMVVSLHQNFWSGFTVDSYYKDLLPAAINIAARRLFLDNLKKSAMTEQAPLPGVWSWNMCAGHEYEISDKLGGVARVKGFIEEAAKHNVQAMIWTNNDQAISSPLNRSERWQPGSWYVMMEDTRQKYGGAYMGCMSVLDYSCEEALRYFIDSHIKIMQETGLTCWFFDSFYNLGFMPINYAEMKPRTMWRGCLQMVRELQQAGANFLIESFGPFGLAQHGHPSSYNLPNIFACYRVGLGNDYSTVPTGHPVFKGHPEGPEVDFYTLAHMAGVHSPLHENGKRIDEIWTKEQVRAVAVYHDVLAKMYTRFLQEDGQSVLWHDEAQTTATLWNFVARTASFPGTVVDLTDGETLPAAATYQLQARHVYTITGAELPVVIG